MVDLSKHQEAVKKLQKNKRLKSQGKLFSGGLGSKIIDAVNIPSYALGGVISGQGPLKGIVNRTSPSIATGTKGWSGFALDVATDPLNFLGGFGLLTGGVKAVKAGKFLNTAKGIVHNPAGLASTLGGQAKAGQRALLTLDVPFVPSLQGIPIIKGQNVLEGMTRLGETIKGIKPIGSLLENVGVRKALNVSSKSAIEVLEEKAVIEDTLSAIRKNAAMVERRFTETLLPTLERFALKAKKIVKDNKLTPDDLALMTRKAYDPNVKLNPVLDELFVEAKDIADTLGAERFDLLKSIGGQKYAESKTLTDKIFPNVLEGLVKGDLPTMIGNSSRIIGMSASEIAAEYAGFKGVDGITVGGRGLNEVKLINGRNLVQVADGVYADTKVKKLLDERAQLESAVKLTAKKAGREKDAIKSMSMRTANNNLQNALKKYPTLEQIRELRPEQFFERVALAPHEATEVAAKFGSSATFSEDILALNALKLQRTAKVAGTAAFVDSAKNLGTPLKKGSKIPEGYARSTIDGLDGYIFPKEIVTHMDATHQAYTSVDGIKEFWRKFDMVQNIWKEFSTIYNVAFHTRNGISNLWQIHLAGALVSKESPKALAYATEITTKLMVKNAVRDAPEKFLKGEVLDLYNEFVVQALGRTGAFTADMGSDLKRMARGNIAKTFEAGGNLVENHAKLTLYVQRRLSGYTPNAAAAEVRKYLFDYSDLTDFERKVLKRAFPFYTWTRKNIPLQVAMLIQKPGKFGTIEKAINAIESNAEGEPLPDNMIPEWLKRSIPVYLGTDANNMKRYIKLQGFLPAVDLNNITDAGYVLDSLTPLIKTPVELIANYSFYQGKAIQEYEGQEKRFMGANIDARLQYIAGQLRPLNEVDKLLGTNDVKKVAAVRSRVVNYLIGKTYDFDLNTQRDAFEYIKARETILIKKSLKRAREKGDTDEVRKLNQRIRQIKRGEGVAL